MTRGVHRSTAARGLVRKASLCQLRERAARGSWSDALHPRVTPRLYRALRNLIAPYSKKGQALGCGPLALNPDRSVRTFARLRDIHSLIMSSLWTLRLLPRAEFHFSRRYTCSQRFLTSVKIRALNRQYIIIANAAFRIYLFVGESVLWLRALVTTQKSSQYWLSLHTDQSVY